jgi:hypothetical protein
MRAWRSYFVDAIDHLGQTLIASARIDIDSGIRSLTTSPLFK